ncbi:MAG: hydroxymethylpyrimidine/phosphomethylpyrimidine kinase [Mariprofundales bacterium]|nr:hydroxymethylpyrimidine/phosphomethylpyrimidine kinase [Mariprofundales bacterium]
MQTACLTIGGSDSCGSAGIQADLAIFHQAGVHGCSVITALTAQNPREIRRIEPVSCAQIAAEIAAIADYYPIGAIKTGMLVDAERIVAVADGIAAHFPHTALVIDPVMVASSGRRLLSEAAVDALIHHLIPHATLITPNMEEAAVLLGHPVQDATSDARTLAAQFGCAVLLKGGHGAGSAIADTLAQADGAITHHNSVRLPLTLDQAHGTGCRAAAAIAAAIALGTPLGDTLPIAHHAAIDGIQIRA